ncbi:MAG: 50S ribosomal protein L13 [Candidatus Woesebacteria bacterium]
MKTVQIKPAEVKREWHLIDAKGKVLGQISTQIAVFLSGKHKVSYTPHVDSGDFVVLINAKEVEVTGNKRADKMYYSHSMIPGGFKEASFEKVMEKDPRKIIEHAVIGMLPKNKMRDPRMARLKIFVGADHTYSDKFKTK